jgi:hypothetical protein
VSTNFPTSLDSYSALTDSVDDVLASHANDRGDAIEALEAKVGIDSSAVTTSHDYRITQLRAGTGMTGSSQATAFIPTGSTVPANGIYLPSANSVALATNTTNRFTIGSTGIMTYGSAADEQIRFVEDQAYISFYNGANSTRTGFLQMLASGTSTLAVDVNQALQFNTNSITRVTIASSGGVTLATPTSGVALTVNGAVSNPAILITTDSAEAIRVTKDNGFISFYNTAGSTRTCYIQGQTPTGLILNTDIAAPIILATNGVTRVTIGATGNSAFTANSGVTPMLVTATGGANAGSFRAAGEIMSIVTSTARGSGANYIRFYDPTGATGYFGYASNTSAMYLWNNLNHDVYIGTNDTLRVTFAASGYTIFQKAAATVPYNIGNSGGTLTIDFTNSNVQTTTLTANVASGGWVLNNPISGQTVNMLIAQDATGSRTLGWPTSFKWPNGSAPVVSTAANAVDLLTLTYHSATGHYYATLLKGFA